MGDLITFQTSRHGERPNNAGPQVQEARILFFTGVRYKREVEPAPALAEQDAPPKGGMDGTGGGRRKRRG
jgi:hypothetical protein